MTARHHPSPDTLLAFASGSLDPARGLVVACHIERCPACAGQVRLMEEVGGALLADAEPTPLTDGALARTLARLDGIAPEAAAVPGRGHDMPVVSQALERCALGPWRWIGPGLHWRSTDVLAEDGTRAFLLRSKPGTRLPHHTHTGVEMTLVLKGAFSHQGGRYAAGDLEEADEATEHQPIVDPGEDCICLVAMNGNLRLLGVMGRLLQPFVRL
ncbi:MAG: ChrR family anti-sigma-E factor [Hyphomicrobiaceae bacterium]|nr:ChrR family anti-sigma-E factor [Hyphomicrobiaceae bacterium]